MEKKPISSNPCWQSRSRKHLGLQWAELPKNHKNTSKSRSISWGNRPQTQGSCWSHPWAAVNNHKQKHEMTENINIRVNVFKAKSSQRPEKNPKWVRAITASPFPALSITPSARYLFLFVGQGVWMLHILQLSSSSWWSMEWLCLLGRCFPKAACLGSSLWLPTQLHWATPGLLCA